MLVVHVGKPCFTGIHGHVRNSLLRFEEGVNFFFERSLGDETVDLNVSLLANAECAVGGLRFDGGVPPQIVMDDLLGSDEVEACATCLEREDEHLAVRIFLEVLDHFGALRLRAAAVIEVRAESEFGFDGGFEQVAHFGKLRKDERLFALILDGREQVEEHLHLARF